MQKFSNSPGLRLQIGRSGLRQLLFGFFCLSCAYSLALLLRDGYVVLAAAMAAPLVLILWPLRREPLVGATVAWAGGQWSIEAAGETRSIDLSGRSACLPWVIYLAWREVPSGAAGAQWLFADSAAPEQLRRLRVRLNLEGRVGRDQDGVQGLGK